MERSEPPQDRGLARSSAPTRPSMVASAHAGGSSDKDRADASTYGRVTSAVSALSHRQMDPVLATSCFVRAPLSRCCGRADNQGMDAPRGSADFEESDELQRLRRRAYGPNADIAGDASAQARLSELEAAQRRERAPVVDTAAALRAPVSERVPVPEPLEGSHPARRRSRGLSTGRPPSMSRTEGRSPSKTPPGCRSPIPNRSTEPSRHRGGAAAACCPGSSPRWRCWPQPSASASSSSMSRTSRGHRSHTSLRRANPRVRPFLSTMRSL